MKRLGIIALVLLLVMGTTACGGNVKGSNNVSDNEISPEVVVDEEIEPEQISSWAVVDVKDEFGDKTGEKRAVSSVVGDFSNTATTGSRLTVLAGVTKDNTLFFVLLEYGDNPATNLSSAEIQISFKNDTSGVKYGPYPGKELNGNGFYAIKDYEYTTNNSKVERQENDGEQRVIDSLSRGDSLIFSITIWKSKYRFTLDGTGFKDAYDQI